VLLFSIDLQTLLSRAKCYNFVIRFTRQKIYKVTEKQLYNVKCNKVTILLVIKW